MDCVVILTPVNSHYFMALEALEVGKINTSLHISIDVIPSFYNINNHLLFYHCFITLQRYDFQNGYHVLCKSPLCTTELEATTLKKAADVKGLIFHVINPFCYYSMTRLVGYFINLFVFFIFHSILITNHYRHEKSYKTICLEKSSLFESNTSRTLILPNSTPPHLAIIFPSKTE